MITNVLACAAQGLFQLYVRKLPSVLQCSQHLLHQHKHVRIRHGLCELGTDRYPRCISPPNRSSSLGESSCLSGRTETILLDCGHYSTGLSNLGPSPDRRAAWDWALAHEDQYEPTKREGRADGRYIRNRCTHSMKASPWGKVVTAVGKTKY